MSCYEALAGAYDALTEDVGYAQRAAAAQRHTCKAGAGSGLRHRHHDVAADAAGL